MLMITLLTRVLSWSTLRTIASYDEVLRQVCATFGIENDLKKNGRKP